MQRLINLGWILAAEIFESRRDSPQDLVRLDFLISAGFWRHDLKMSAAFWPPSLLNLGEIQGRILAAEIEESRLDFGR